MTTAHHGLTEGAVIEVRQFIPETVPYYRAVYSKRLEAKVPEWAERAYASMARVEAVQGAQVQLDIPLPLTFLVEHQASVRPVHTAHTVRIEGIAFERKEANYSHTLHFKNTENVLIKDIASLQTARYHLLVERSIDVIVEGSYFDGTYVAGGGGEGYGVSLRHSTTRALVTNNIFRDLRHHVVVHLGANQSVVSYNYVVDHTKLPDFSIHGHYAHHVLFEGNYGWRWGLGDWWGPTGPGFVLFRNRIRGIPGGEDNSKTGVMIWLSDYGQQIVGNDFDKGAGIWYRGGHSERRHRVMANQRNGARGATTVFPNSLYLNAPPAFWKEDLSWPPYGPGLSGSAARKIPAQVRWERREDRLPVKDM